MLNSIPARCLSMCAAPDNQMTESLGWTNIKVGPGRCQCHPGPTDGYVCPRVSLPGDGQEGLAVQLLLDGTLQTIGVAMERGVPIVRQQCHQQEEHVHQEALGDRDSPVVSWSQLTGSGQGFRFDREQTAFLSGYLALRNGSTDIQPAPLLATEGQDSCAQGPTRLGGDVRCTVA